MNWHARRSVWLLFLLAVPGLAGGQSLGEAARREREKREKRPKTETSARPLTEADLASTRGRLANERDPAPADEPEASAAALPSPSSPNPAEAAGAETAAAEEEAAARALAERSWRARVASARTRVDIAQQRYDDYDRMIRIGQPAYYDAAGKRVLMSAQGLKALADEAQAELAEAKQALEDLLEAARRAGALPGWLR